MNGDRLTRVGTAAAVLLVAAIAAIVSFVHIEHLALTHGQTALAAALLPVSIDGAVCASALTMLRSARLSLPPPPLARFMLALSVLATLSANVLYGLPYGLTGALISGWPAVAFIGCTEMAIGMVRRARTSARAGEAAPGLPALVPPVPAPVPLPTHRQVREEYRCGPATAKKIRAGMAAAVKAASNGRPDN